MQYLSVCPVGLAQPLGAWPGGGAASQASWEVAGHAVVLSSIFLYFPFSFFFNSRFPAFYSTKAEVVADSGVLGQGLQKDWVHPPQATPFRHRQLPPDPQASPGRISLFLPPVPPGTSELSPEPGGASRLAPAFTHHHPLISFLPKTPQRVPRAEGGPDRQAWPIAAALWPESPWLCLSVSTWLIHFMFHPRKWGAASGRGLCRDHPVPPWPTHHGFGLCDLCSRQPPPWAGCLFEFLGKLQGPRRAKPPAGR